MPIQPGFFGIVDFTGIPAGPATSFIAGRGFRGAGKRTYVRQIIHSMEMADQWRLLRRLADSSFEKRKEEAAANELAQKKITVELEIARRQAMLSSATYTLLLGEI